MATFLVVGLGNPGSQYAMTRHNIGFLTLDVLAESYGSRNWTQEQKASVLKLKTDLGQLILVKPQTYMNRSGESVIPLLNYYKIEPSHFLVVQDDIDQAPGKMRFHKNRGHGGHNGIRHISEQLGHADYARLKLGVGRPPTPGPDVADWVLGKFGKDEEAGLAEFLNRAGDAIECWMAQGLQIASTRYNSPNS